MAIKTTIGPQGVVSEKIAGTVDKLIINTDRTVETFASSSADSTGTVVIQPPFMLLRPGASGLVTGSLPTVGVEELGTRILVLKDDTDGTLVLSGATGNPVVHDAVAVAGATLELKSSTANAAFDLIASVSGSSYYWYSVVGSGSYAAAF